MSRRTVDVTADLVLRAYRIGMFPMAENRTSEKLYWLDPELRGRTCGPHNPGQRDFYSPNTNSMVKLR